MKIKNKNKKDKGTKQLLNIITEKFTQNTGIEFFNIIQTLFVRHLPPITFTSTLYGPS